MNTKKYKRWYDHDPLLLEVMDMLKSFQSELRVQSQVFLEKIEAQVDPELIDKFYETVKPYKNSSRWYDQDPLLSKTIELLRIVPPEAQRRAASSFLEALEKQGITPERLKEALEEEQNKNSDNTKDYSIKQNN